MTDHEYQLELANHANFYQKQKEVAIRLEQAILHRYFNEDIDRINLDVIVIQEVRKELRNLSESEAMGRPNAPGYYRANND